MKPCDWSMNDRPDMHWSGGKGEETVCHDLAPSVVFQSNVAVLAQVDSHPSASSTNEISVASLPAGAFGVARSCQVWPRSAETNSRTPPTSAHTTFADGADRSAVVGMAIGLGDGLGGMTTSAAQGVVSCVQCVPPSSVRRTAPPAVA